MVEKCNRLAILGRQSDVSWHFEKRPRRNYEGQGVDGV